MHGTVYADRVSWAVLLCSYFYACNTVQRGQFLMTSEERHEARYQRRVKKRQERRLALSKSCGDFEDVFSYENLYQAGHICCRGVSWKSSTQMYRFNLVTNTATTRRTLLDGSYKSRGFIEFDLYDRGKMRHIRSIHISERVVQRTLCDKVINPTLSTGRSAVSWQSACMT